jgi:hypothetical protein
VKAIPKQSARVRWWGDDAEYNRAGTEALRAHTPAEEHAGWRGGV